MKNKIVFLISLFLFSFSLPASAKTPLPEILGSWYFEGPQSTEWGSPFREMTLNFTEKGYSELLVWIRGGEGVCRRTAFFWYDESTRILHQTAIRLDSHSPADCVSIPEMNVGTETRHQVSIEGERMVLRSGISAGEPEISEWTFAFP